MIVDNSVVAFAPKGITDYNIPYGATSIGSFAFAQNDLLINVTLPLTVEKIGWSAFRDCISLKAISIPSSVKSIEPYAFMNTPSLDLVLPDGLVYSNDYR